MSTLSHAASLRQSVRRSRDPLPRRLLALLRLWHHRATSRSQLRQLDEHLLRDIGISRETARFVADKPFWRE